MLKKEYARHIVEMSEKVRMEEGAGLQKNKEEFFETGNIWALSWLGHLTALDAVMYNDTGDTMAGADKRGFGGFPFRAG